MDFVQRDVFTSLFSLELDHMDETILFQASNIDFRYWFADSVFHFARICRLVSLLSVLCLFVLTCIQDLSTAIVHVEPSCPVDYRLLEYSKLMIKNGVARPATFPLIHVSP
jgi:hypothetical protein